MKINNILLIASPFAIVYFGAMFIAPLFIYKFNWVDIHQVWMDWQTLNAGILAIISSVIALYSVKYQQIRAESKEVQVARAMFPDTLSELCDYTNAVSRILIRAYELVEGKMFHTANGIGIDMPLKPARHMDVISLIIKNSDDKIIYDLSIFVNKLQILHSRTNTIHSSLYLNSTQLTTKIHVLNQMVLLSEIQAYIGIFFDYSRVENLNKISSKITKEKMRNSISSLNLDVGFKLPDDLESILNSRFKNIE